MGAGPGVGGAGRARALRWPRPRPVIARAARADARAGGARRGSRRAGLNLVRTRETVGPGAEHRSLRVGRDLSPRPGRGSEVAGKAGAGLGARHTPRLFPRD
ncbi:unnamed protein product [Rangifer tarandus platyrhynchus]|uniref:Uncharacterized protein n=2 Tax=Rangifer tarandus platyrhynchus TaxID=3082113 RepID=A0ACB0EDU8_RANTA|nr:unnamed protein product [Rangifer tarandus platyrhynchus]CAI9698741.1 unnamed protein product [Rangifer tarandus platyrhynchus]